MSYDSSIDTIKHIERVGTLIRSVEARLAIRRSIHDYSKLHEPEKSKFDEVTPRLKGLTYGSDEYKASLKELGVALNHHYAHNRHHPEHFCMMELNSDNGVVAYEVDKASLAAGDGIRSMSLIDIIEMLMDWKAASERHDNGDIIKSIYQNQERFGYSDEMRDILLNTAEEMRWT